MSEEKKEETENNKTVIQNDPKHGENCNDLYTACKKCYTEFREWQLTNKQP